MFRFLAALFLVWLYAIGLVFLLLCAVAGGVLYVVLYLLTAPFRWYASQ